MKGDGSALALDAVLADFAAALGEDYVGYRNHAQRVTQICIRLASADAEQREKIAVAAALHDIGIWTAGTFDYLEPSVRVAEAFLAATGRRAWAPEIAAMIRQHHKLTPWRGDAGRLVEPFRRADLVDVSRGLVRFGLPRDFLRALYVAWPGAGFHRRLIALELAHLRKDPLHPLPMVRL